MDRLVPQAYRKYGLYVNNFRAFPLKDDGLKPVERRMLLTTYLVAREKFVKSARVTGTCMARFHPHSDAYGTLFQMVKNGFVEGQGNWGNNLGVDSTPPAASRYTECKIFRETVNDAFNLIKYVPWGESELDDEPEYLPTKFPFCLMGTDYTQGIGFGFRTYIPCFQKDDLKKRLFWLLSGKKGVEPIIAPMSNCKITSPKIELQSLLTTGKGKINVQGLISVSAVQCKVVVKSWPPGKRFESILNKASIKKQLENLDIGFIDSSNGKNGTAIIFSVTKQRNREKIFKECVKNLKDAIKGSVSFETITVDMQKQVQVTSIDDMLLNTYAMYTKANQRMLVSEIGKANDAILEMDYLEKIKGPLVKVMSQKGALLTKEDLPKIIKQISIESKVEENVVKELITKYRIQKLLTFKTDTQELNDKRVALQTSLSTLDKFVLDQYR
jgi:DNA gyrase/topoisomerase IV subunit A